MIRRARLLVAAGVICASLGGCASSGGESVGPPQAFRILIYVSALVLAVLIARAIEDGKE